MTSQQLFAAGHLARIRELETELVAAKRELHEKSCRLAELEAHFAVAVAAVRDAEEADEIAIFDGWNLLNTSRLKTKSALIAFAREWCKEGAACRSAGSLPAASKGGAAPAALPCVAAPPSARSHRRRAWLVFDGPEEKTELRSRAALGAEDFPIRISYTGGKGSQRADRLILDYVHAMRFAGVRPEIFLATDDRKLLTASACKHLPVRQPNLEGSR